MGVFVLEIQDNVCTPTYYSQQQYESGVADQKFHEICSYAAVSSVERHVVLMINEEGGTLKQEIFIHQSQTNQE